MIVLNGETRSLKRAAIVMKRVVGLKVSTNTIERISLEAGNDLEVADAAAVADGPHRRSGGPVGGDRRV